MESGIRTYSLRQLSDYAGSAHFAVGALLPFSSLRAASWLLNPHAQDSGLVLAEYYEDGKRVAFRSVLPDTARGRDGSSLRFAWLSGSFVLPEYRRRGIATRLLECLEEAWDGQLAYSNYAPAAGALFTVTGHYKPLASINGTTFHLRSPFRSRYATGGAGDRLLGLADGLLNIVHDPFVGFGRKDEPCAEARMVDNLSPELAAFINEQQADALFFRDSKTFSWIRSFPWVREGTTDKESSSYHFSLVSSRFFNHWYEVRDTNARLIAFAWLKGMGTRLSVPYLLAKPENMTEACRCTARLLLTTARRYRMERIAVHYPELERELRNLGLPYLLARPSERDFHVHDALAGRLDGGGVLHPGDGDYVFT